MRLANSPVLIISLGGKKILYLVAEHARYVMEVGVATQPKGIESLIEVGYILYCPHVTWPSPP